MRPSLPRNLDTLDNSDGMIQLLAIMLEPAFHGASPRGNASARGQDELHMLRHKREQVVPSIVNDLGPAVRHVARLRQFRRDLARVHRVLHERRADEYGRLAVRVRERRPARSLHSREGGCDFPERAQRDAVPRGWDLLQESG